MRDEKLILAQDDDFLRLALEPGLPASRIQVKDSTLKESMSLPLKTGNRPPLFIHVLRSAKAYWGHRTAYC